jgi:hypothetical protein
MKKALLTIAALAVASSTYGQGIITFFNNNLSGATGVYRAGIFRDNDPANLNDVKGDSTIGAGAGYTVGLFLAGSSTPLATTTFRTTTAQEVFATSQDVVVPGIAPGQTANLVVRAWNTSAGSFAAAQTAGEWGEQAFTSRALGGPNPDPTQPAIPQPDMGPGFTGFEMNVVPEPSTIALATLGIGALFLRRRK